MKQMSHALESNSTTLARPMVFTAANRSLRGPLLAGLSSPSCHARHRLPVHLDNLPCGKKNFWSDVGEDPGSDPAVAAEIERALSLLPIDIPGEDR
jgi:hypothetical protein